MDSGISSPAELQERLEAERRGLPFLVYRGEGEQRILTLEPELGRLTIGRGQDKVTATKGARKQGPSKIVMAKVRDAPLEPVTPGITKVNARLKLTSKGARRLNQALEAGRRGPFEEGPLGRVATYWHHM